MLLRTVANTNRCFYGQLQIRTDAFTDSYKYEQMLLRTVTTPPALTTKSRPQTAVRRP